MIAAAKAEEQASIQNRGLSSEFIYEYLNSPRMKGVCLAECHP